MSNCLSLNNFRIWLKACRLPSNLYLSLPVLLGMTYNINNTKELLFIPFLLAIIYCFCLQFFIVFANDYADYQTDCLNKTWTMFSGGSRVLPDKLIEKNQMKKAFLFMAFLTAILSLYLAFHIKRKEIFFLGISGLFLLWLYSFKPLQLSYKGGGELLQAVGLAWILPFFGLMVQNKNVSLEFLTLLAWLSPSQLACAISTAFPDYPSDKVSNKKTLVVRIKKDKAVYLIIFLQFLTYLNVFFNYYNSNLRLFLWTIGVFFVLCFLILLSHKKQNNSLLVFSSILLSLNILLIEIMRQAFFL